MPQTHWHSDGVLEIIPNKKIDKYSILEFDLPGLSCCNTDFIALQAQFDKLQNLGSFKGAELFFTNDIAKDHSRIYLAFDHCHTDLSATNKYQEIIFSMRDLPEWQFGGNCHGIKVILPADTPIKIKSIKIPDGNTLTPAIYLKSSADSNPGEIKFNKCNIQHVRYNAQPIAGCKNVILEIAKPSEYLQSLDLPNSKSVYIKKSTTILEGEFILDKNEFSHKPTIYRARLRALDQEGNQLGFPSNYFFIVIDS